MSPLAIDLFCGLGGWTEGLLAENYFVVGFDIECHDYGTGGYPAQLVLQDVLTLHGKQFKDAALIVASPPCQEYSYMAMPWSRAKAIAAEYRSGVRDVKKLTALFDACFRIQREAIEAAGHFIPMVVENVRGAIPWVGRSRWNFGSFHLWGDVPALMPMVKRAVKNPDCAQWRPNGCNEETRMVPSRADTGVKVPGMNWSDRLRPAQAFNDTAIRNMREEIKNTGGSWFNVAHNTASGKGQNPDGRPVCSLFSNAENQPVACFSDDGVKQGGDWFGRECESSVSRMHGSKSKARKAASAAIAKIPFALAQHIAKCWRPHQEAA